MICRSCKQAIHRHQAQGPALLSVHQGGRRRLYRLCGECCERLERLLGRQARPEAEVAGARR